MCKKWHCKNIRKMVKKISIKCTKFIDVFYVFYEIFQNEPKNWYLWQKSIKKHKYLCGGIIKGFFTPIVHGQYNGCIVLVQMKQSLCCVFLFKFNVFFAFREKYIIIILDYFKLSITRTCTVWPGDQFYIISLHEIFHVGLFVHYFM